MHSTLLLDLRGFIYKNLAAGNDPDAIIGEDFTSVNSASYGVRQFFNNTFPKLIQAAGNPCNIIMCSDRGHEFRSRIHPGYKVKPKDESGLSEQLKLAEDMVVNIMMRLGASHVYLGGEEADDIICTLAKKLKGIKQIFTIDKDLIALASTGTLIYHNGDLVTDYKVKDGEETFAVRPSDITIYLSLVGDTSDKVPGVKGFGKKAWQLLYSSDVPPSALQDLIYNPALPVPVSEDAKVNKLIEKIITSDTWRMSFALVSLRMVGLSDLNPLKWERRVHTEEGLRITLEGYSLFNSLFPSLVQYTVVKTLVTSATFEEVLDSVDFQSEDSYITAVDYETSDKVRRFKEINKKAVDVLNSRITGFSICIGGNLQYSYYFPVAHKDTDNISLEQLRKLMELLDNCKTFKIAHNAPFESLVSQRQLGFNFRNWTDTAQLAHVLDENSRVGLKSLSYRYLNYRQASYEEVMGLAEAPFVPDFEEEFFDDPLAEEKVEEEIDTSLLSELTMEDLRGDQVLDYGCDDSIVTAILYQHLSRLAIIEGSFTHVMTAERDASALLTTTTYSGICVDWDEVRRQYMADKQTMIDSLTTIHRVLGDHCMVPTHEGLHEFFNDYEPYFQAKRVEAMASGDEKKMEKAKNLANSSLNSWKDFMAYVPESWVKPKKFFTLTPARFNKVCGYLGLPVVEKVSGRTLAEWLRDMPPDQFDSPWVKAVDNYLTGGVSKVELEEIGSQFLTDYQEPVRRGTEISLTSPLVRQKLLYIMLGFPIRIRSKNQKGGFRQRYRLRGAPAGNASACVNALIYDCGGENAWKKDILNAMMAFMKAKTRCSNYWDKWPVWACEYGRLHPNFRRLGTKTGRPTSNNPNFNSIDKKAQTRACIVPPFQDWVIFSGDFANQEMRRLGNVSQDAGLISAFIGENKVDLHSLLAVAGAHFLLPVFPEVDSATISFTETSAIGTPVIGMEWFEKNRDATQGYPHYDFLNKVRDAAKIVNFGVAYGVTAPSLSEQARIPLEAAEMFFSIHETRFPGIPVWKQTIWEKARHDGSIPLFGGVRRHCGDNLSVGNKGDIARWERQIANSDIQGWCGYYAGDMLGKVRRANIFGQLEDTPEGLVYVPAGDLRAVLYVNLYDELMGACHKDDLHTLIHRLKPLMEGASLGDTIPQVTDWSFGPNWKKQIEVGKNPTAEDIEAALKKIFPPEHPIGE